MGKETNEKTEIELRAKRDKKKEFMGPMREVKNWRETGGEEEGAKMVNNMFII